MKEARSNGGGDVESGGAQGGCTQEIGENDEERTDTHTGGEVSTRTQQEECNTQGQAGAEEDARETDMEIREGRSETAQESSMQYSQEQHEQEEQRSKMEPSKGTHRSETSNTGGER